MRGFDGVQRGNYLGGEPTSRTKVEVKVRKLKNEKAAGKDEATEEKIKSRGNRVVDCIWKLCNIGNLL